MSEMRERLPLDMLRNVAARRRDFHTGSSSDSEHYSRDDASGELFGLVGEDEFGRYVDALPDLADRREGDGGIDFTIGGVTIDVKTARVPAYLIHPEGKVRADVYVLAGCTDVEAGAQLVGWARGKVLAAAPVRKFGYSIRNHYIKANQLDPIHALIGELKHQSLTDDTCSHCGKPLTFNDAGFLCPGCYRNATFRGPSSPT